MADNQDYKDFEYMTGKNDKNDDIDVIFNSEDKRKVIIPSQDELKDFPEERLNDDDYISDEDLDFVDSIIEEESFHDEDNRAGINLYEEEQAKIDLDSLLSSDSVKLDVPDMEDVKLDFNPEDTKNFFNDKIEISDDAGVYLTKPAEEITPSETSDESEHESIIVPSVKEEDEKETNDIPEMKNDEQDILKFDSFDSVEDNDRIEIVVKDVNQEVLQPESDEKKVDEEEVKSEEQVTSPVQAEEIKDITSDEPELISSDEQPELITSDEPELISSNDKLPEEDEIVKSENKEITPVENYDEIKSEIKEIINLDDIESEKVKNVEDTAAVSDEEQKPNVNVASIDDIEDIKPYDILIGDDLEDKTEDVKSEKSEDISFDDIEDIKPDDILIGDETKEKSAEKNTENQADDIIYLDTKPEEDVHFVSSSEISPVEVDKEISLHELYSSSHSDDYRIIEEEDVVPAAQSEEPKVEQKVEKAEDQRVELKEEHEEPEISSENIIIAPEEDNTIIVLDEPEEVEKPKSEEEELLEENVFAVCNIDSKKGFYLGKSDNGYALYGYVNDEIYTLKEFPELYNKTLGIRLNERTKHSSTYLVRVNNSRLLVNVDKESMSVSLEL